VSFRITLSDLANIHWQEASHGLSATAELIVVLCIREEVTFWFSHRPTVMSSCCCCCCCCYYYYYYYYWYVAAAAICENGGVCYDVPTSVGGGYHCACPVGLHGSHCELGQSRVCFRLLCLSFIFLNTIFDNLRSRVVGINLCRQTQRFTQTDTQTDKQTDRQTDRQTDQQAGFFETPKWICTISVNQTKTVKIDLIIHSFMLLIYFFSRQKIIKEQGP